MANSPIQARTLRHASLLLLFTTSLIAQSDHGFGAVSPVPIPQLQAHDHNGREVDLSDLLAGRRTAIQFIFTDCPTTCPLLGSLFQRVQKALPASDESSQLLTITVDPARDTPSRLTEWLQTFHHTPRWTALRLKPTALNKLLRTLSVPPGPAVAHSLQIFLIDSAGRYVARTTALPTSTQVLTALQSPAENPPHPGARIYRDKHNFVATIDGEPLAPRAARCANCHGLHRAGGSEGEVLAPSLLPSQLLTSRPRRGGPPSAYTEATFCQSLQSGRDPAGVQFSSVMPRYQIESRTCRTLWNFLTSPR